MKEHENQQFDELFQMSFEDFEVTPPSHLWNNIEREIPLPEEDDIFRGSFANFEVEPPPAVWQNVQKRLPINLVVRRHLTMLSRVAAALLVGMFGLLTFDQYMDSTTTNGSISAEVATVTTGNEVIASTNTNTVAKTEAVPTPTIIETTTNTAKVTKTAKTTTSVNTATVAAVLNNDESTVNTALPTSENNNNNGIAGRTSQGVNADYYEDNATLASKETAAIAQMNQNLRTLESVFTLANMDALPSISDENIVANAITGGLVERRPLSEMATNDLTNKPEELFKKSAMEYKGFYVSIATQAGFSKISSNNILAQIGTGATYAPDYGIAYNLSGGYKATNRLAIELGVNYSKQGQRYREIDGGERITTADLSYVQVPLTVKYRKSELSSEKPSSFSYIGGLQYGRILSNPTLNATLNGASIDSPIVSSDLFVQNELGLLAGVDYDVYLNKNLSLSIGGRASVGKDVAQLFANSSTNIQFGGRVGMNYRFAK